MRFTVGSALSLLLLIAGVAFYAYFSGVLGARDVGTYAVTVVLVAFGLVGFLMASADRR